MNKTLRDAAQQALDALDHGGPAHRLGAMHALRSALAQQQDEQPRSTGFAAKRDHYAMPVLFNPYTGAPRDVRDVQSDPQGILIQPPGAQLVAAPPAAQPAVPLTLKEVERLIYENTRLNVNQRDDVELVSYIVNAVRAVERAHGIGKESGDAAE